MWMHTIIFKNFKRSDCKKSQTFPDDDEFVTKRGQAYLVIWKWFVGQKAEQITTNHLKSAFDNFTCSLSQSISK